MLSATLQAGLEAYAIGPKIRAIRLKKMGLVELGRHTGLSPALLSKIERGQLFPTLETLLRIALVFSVGGLHPPTVSWGRVLRRPHCIVAEAGAHDRRQVDVSHQAEMILWTRKH